MGGFLEVIFVITSFIARLPQRKVFLSSILKRLYMVDTRAMYSSGKKKGKKAVVPSL